MNRTLILKTLAMVIAATLFLATGLMVLSASAMGDDIIPEESLVPAASENIDNGETEKEESLPIIEDDQVEEQKKYPHLGGGYAEEENRGLVIDIFDNATGNLVAQKIIFSEEISSYIDKLFTDSFDHANILFDPDQDEEFVCLPKAKYRVEVWGRVWFSYSYGVENNTVWEFTQTGLTFNGGESFISYVDELINDDIAELEAGADNGLTYEDQAAYVCGMTEVWKKQEELNNVYRYTPRFPYIVE